MKTAKIITFFLCIIIEGIILFFPKCVLASGSALMVYDKEDVSSIPKYRLWDGSWGSEGTANAVSGEIRHMVVKYAPTRDEAIMVVQTSTGEIQAQVFDGSNWGDVTVLGTHFNTLGSTDAQSMYRGFDVEYEQTSGDAIVVYGDGTKNPDYQVWNGSLWSGASDIDVATSVNPNWIELASQTSGDNVAMILVDGSADVVGRLWGGDSWSDMGDSAVWDTTATLVTKKCLDVAFETNTGEIMFLWGTTTAADDHHYRTYAGGTLSANVALANGNAGGQPHWIKLARNPNTSSNQIMLGTLDAGADLNTYIWSGGGWSAVHAEHSSATENIIDMNFDISFETHSSNTDDAWLTWGAGTLVYRKLWNGPTSAWAGAATTSDDDTAQVNLAAQPNSGAMLAIIYDDQSATNDDIRQINLTGGAQVWSASGTISSGPIRRRLGHFYFDIAAQGYNSSTEAMVVYDTQTLTATPKYRLWSGTSWGSEADAQDVQGEIRHMVVKFSPTRNEAILATLGSNGILQAQVWDGDSWGTPETIGSIVVDVDSIYDTQTLYRGFDLDYEQSSGDAVIVYGDGTPDPDYKVWNGSSWSGSGTNIDLPNSIIPNWIELSANYDSASDTLAMIVLDGSADVSGRSWNGSSWSDMGDATIWDTTAGPATRKGVDVAFERNSGDILFAWADGTAATHWNYRTYSGGSLGAVTALTNGGQAGIGQWVRLAANPLNTSDQIMIAGVDAGSDFNTRLWDGSAWDAAAVEHSTGLEDIVDMNFDVAFESYSGNPNVAWIVFGNGTTVSRRRWGGASWVAPTTAGDDTAQVAIDILPFSGSVLVGLYEDDNSTNDDLTSINLTNGGSTWSAPSSNWSGPVRRNLGQTLISIASERVYVDYTQDDFEWYVDDASVSLSNIWPLGGGDDFSENTWLTQIPVSNETLDEGDRIRIQMNFQVARYDLNTLDTTFILQYAASEDCTTASIWSDVGEKDSDSIWRLYDNESLADSVNQENQISTSTSGAEGLYSETLPSELNPNSVDKDTSQISEWDWPIEDNGAVPNTTYCFRMAEGDGVIFSYNADSYPKVTTAPGPENMMRHGNFFQNFIERGLFWLN